MAITRAQQAKQMLQDGGMLVSPSTTGKRPGYRGDDARKSAAAMGKGAMGTTKKSGGGRKDPMGSGYYGTPEGKKQLAEQSRRINEMREKGEGIFADQKPKPEFDLPQRKILYNLFPNNPGTELGYLSRLKNFHPTAYDRLPPNLKERFEETEFDLETRSYKDFDKFSYDDFQDLENFESGLEIPGLENFAEYAATYAGAPGLKFSGNVGGLEKYVTGKDPITGQTMYGYRDKPDNGGGGESDLEARLRLLEQQRAAGSGSTDTEEVTSAFQPNFRLLAGGGMAERAPYEGGIMDLESARQMYGLGKLVKKVTRSVKKIVKSPLGKAAVLGAVGFGIPGVSSGFFSKGLMGTQLGLGAKNFLTNKILGTPIAGDITGTRAGGLFNFIKNNPFLTIGGASLASGLMTKADEDDEEEQYAGADLPFPIDYYLSGQYPPNMRLAAEGGLMRAGYQEGSKEPVAKKTMPLLEMGGMEKDYREEGGFVPIGRMEKADDVPARLSKNEFVFTADAVRNAGDGDVDLGAEKMYNMMKNLEAGGDVSEESQGLEGARKMFQTSQRLEEVL